MIPGRERTAATNVPSRAHGSPVAVNIPNNITRAIRCEEELSMVTQQRADIALNYSYVLHDRSDSDTVRRYVGERDAESRRCAKAIHEFTRLSDAELRQRLIVIDHTTRRAGLEPHRVRLISVDVGAGDLFPRLLQVAGIVKPAISIAGRMLDGPRAADQRQVTFFGAPAYLSIADAPVKSDEQTMFASAVLRPGYSSILLRVTSLDSDGATSEPDWQQAAHLAETVIREFPLQWWCTRPLWSRPVEETLPEFRSRENGTTACGR